MNNQKSGSMSRFCHGLRYEIQYHKVTQRQAFSADFSQNKLSDAIPASLSNTLLIYENLIHKPLLMLILFYLQYLSYCMFLQDSDRKIHLLDLTEAYRLLHSLVVFYHFQLKKHVNICLSPKDLMNNQRIREKQKQGNASKYRWCQTASLKRRFIKKMHPSLTANSYPAPFTPTLKSHSYVKMFCSRLSFSLLSVNATFKKRKVL